MNATEIPCFPNQIRPARFICDLEMGGRTISVQTMPAYFYIDGIRCVGRHSTDHEIIQISTLVDSRIQLGALVACVADIDRHLRGGAA